MLERDDPELIVMLIGGWEDQRAYEVPGTLGSEIWQQNYREGVLDPFTELATSTGAQLLWVGFPPVGNPRATTTHIRMNRSSSRSPWIILMSSTSIAALFCCGSDDMQYTESIDGADGPIRLRSNDSHLCPEAVVRLAEPLVAMIEGAWAIDVDDAWADGDWRQADLLPDPTTCDL